MENRGKKEEKKKRNNLRGEGTGRKTLTKHISAVEITTNMHDLFVVEYTLY
jgi:hypothetical protein